ncbi:MAG: bifunctional enoyl-CoA hydratase/phosphate acetyltransferase [Pseudomonadota bacterium]
MATEFTRMQNLIDRAKTCGPIRLAVVGAGQGLVLDGLQQAKSLGLIEPCLIGNAREISDLATKHGWDQSAVCIAAVDGDSQVAAAGARLVHEGRVDAIMKGHIHTDVLMRALLHETNGLRVPGRRASHVFIVEVPSYPKLLCVTDAAVNITPDLIAKAQILQNAAEVTRTLGIATAKAAILSAVETVNPAIASTLDAAALTLMARRGQISGVLVDGPLAFDVAISAAAAKEKGIASEVAGDADIILVPDLVSGNILVKNLEYLAGATLAGAVVGLAAPVILTSRADPVAARVASIALAVLLHKSEVLKSPVLHAESESTVYVAPQPEVACCPLPA